MKRTTSFCAKLTALTLSLMTAISSISTPAFATTYEEASRAFKLDTVNYTMAPGNIYDFKVTLKGALTQSDVKVSDSRTGSVVKLTPVKGTDKYRITGRTEGTSYVVAEVGGAHLSFTVTVKKGVKQSGIATRSNFAVVPDSYKAVSSGSGNTTAANVIDPATGNYRKDLAQYSAYARPYDITAIMAEMRTYGEQKGMTYDENLKVTGPISTPREDGYVDTNCSYNAPDWTEYEDADFGHNSLGLEDGSAGFRQGCLGKVDSVYNLCKLDVESHGGVLGSSDYPVSGIHFRPIILPDGDGEYYIYVFYG